MSEPKVSSALEGWARVVPLVVPPARGDWVCDLSVPIGPPIPIRTWLITTLRNHLASPGSAFSPAAPGTFPSGITSCDGNVAFLKGKAARI